jgi:hypothetical protein
MRGRSPETLGGPSLELPIPTAIAPTPVLVGVPLIGAFQLLSSLPSPGTNLLILLLVGVPAWVVAIFTVLTWYKSIRLRQNPPVSVGDEPLVNGMDSSYLSDEEAG